MLVIHQITRCPRADVQYETLLLTREDAERGYGKFSTVEGTEVFLSLPRNQGIASGDVVYCEDGRGIRVAIQYAPVIEITLLPVESDEMTSRLSQIWGLSHFIGNQHFPLRVVDHATVRIPVNHPGRLLELLKRFSIPQMNVTVAEGHADDPLPNPQAHGDGSS